MTGTVKTMLNGKNFGFIRAENGDEYFFHREDFNGHWDDLMRDWLGAKNTHIPVTFEGMKSDKGKRANNVRRLDFPNQTV